MRGRSISTGVITGGEKFLVMGGHIPFFGGNHEHFESPTSVGVGVVRVGEICCRRHTQLEGQL